MKITKFKESKFFETFYNSLPKKYWSNQKPSVSSVQMSSYNEWHNVKIGIPIWSSNIIKISMT